jgi:four helix bundle protein
MPTYKSFQELPLWMEAVEFAAEIYLFCEQDTLQRRYRLKEQLCAAASSVSNNIAEGFEYGRRKDFIRFLIYSKGSSAELFNQFTILFKAGIIDQKMYNYYAEKVLSLNKRIGGFIQYLHRLPPK